jgi:hypothetical protein
VRVSNKAFEAILEADVNDIADEKHDEWRLPIEETERAGIFAFYAEPGYYYIESRGRGYFPKYHSINVTRGETTIHLDMVAKMESMAVFVIVDMYNSKPIPNVEITVYDDIGTVMQKGMTDDRGHFQSKINLLSRYQVRSKKEGYIELLQDFAGLTSSVLEKLCVRMIPKLANPVNDF